MQKEVELNIPENIDVDRLIPEGLKLETRKKFHDRIIYLLHTIKSRLNNKKVFESYIESGYVPLMKRYLIDIMGTQTEAVISILTDAEIIRVDTSYQKGIRSMGYVLTEKYIAAPTKKVSLISYEVIKIYREINDSHKKAQRKMASKIPKVISQLNKPWRIDTDKARQWISEFERRFYKTVRASKKIQGNRKEDIITKYHQYYRYIEHLIDNINQGTTDYIIDAQAGRLHTAFTSLPRPLKNFLTYEGQPLATIDIKNSQPLLFSYMTKSTFWSTTQGMDVHGHYKGEFTLMRIGTKIHKQLIKEHKAARNAIIMILKSRESIENSGSQTLNFLCLTLDGRLYEYIMEHFRNRYFEGDIDRFGDRTLTKREVLRIMYFDTKNEKAPFYAPFKQFTKLFPVEAEIMRLIKSCGYTQFPVLLQKIESKLMLEKVGEHMPKDIPFLTIHDSLIIPADDKVIASATELIRNQFDHYLTIKPRISAPEILVPDNGFKLLDGYIQEKLTNLEIRFFNRKDTTPGDMDTEGYGEDDED